MAILYESTNRKAPKVTFSEALMRGQAPDAGLYTPDAIPKFAAGDIESFRKMSYHKVAHSIAMRFLEGEIPSKDVAEITRQAYDFDVPFERVLGRNYVMRLDRGPTASFKDFAARMMARLISYFLRQQQRDIVILTATSGDTGSAVANAFHGVQNARVVVLFPRDEVTERQRRQMTTLGGNVSIVAVDGKFDDCQALVKRAFQDEDLHGLNLSSANSINFGRLLPQSVYYTYAYSRLCESPTEPIVFSVPSGNFGDLMGGMIAKRMGLPVRRFLVATNENDEFPSFLKSGEYMPLRPSRACISNAMNVGHPSNLARLFHMYGGWMDETGQVRMKPDIESMRRDLWSSGVSDKETRDAIKDAYERHRLILEPHGAVGWAALRQYERLEGESFAVSLETADPAKFPDEIRSVLGFEPEIPDSLMGLAEKTEQLESMSRDYGQLKRYLLRMAD